jgi:hypothetical protein
MASLLDRLKSVQEGKVDAPTTGGLLSRLGLDEDTTPAIDTQTDSGRIRNAIKQTESGGRYDTSGASGETGAYQFMPATWDSFSSEYNKGKGALKQTPENEEAVVEFKINQWIKKGLTPQQIAAKWNSGSEKGWESKRGVNKHGVEYDVPAYVNKVMSVYGETEPDLSVKLGTAHKPYVPLADTHSSAKDRVVAKNIDPEKKSTVAAPMDAQIASIFARMYQEAGQGTADIARTAALSREHLDNPDYMINNNLDWSHMTPVEQAEVAKSFQGKSEEEIRNLRLQNYDKRRTEFITAAKDFAEWFPEVEAKKTTGALGVLDDITSGMSRFAPTMIGGALTGGAASFPLAYMQLMPGKYEEYTKAGTDKERAFNTAQSASIAMALVEGLGTNLQLSKMGQLFKKGAAGKSASTAFTKFIDQVVANGLTEGFEELTQGEIEVVFDVYAKNPGATPEEMGKKAVAIWKDPKFQKEKLYEAAIGFGGGAGMGGGATVISAAANKIQDRRSETVGDGVHVVMPEDEDGGGGDVAQSTPKSGRPTVKNMLGLDSGDSDVEVGEATPDGVSVGANLNTTAEQGAGQIKTNEGVKAIIEKIANEKVNKDSEIAINSGEAKLESLEGFYEDAVLDEDHEGALRIAEMMKAEADNLTKNYQTLSQAYLKDLTQKKLLPDQDEFTDIELHVAKVNERVNKAVASQKTALNNIRIQEQQNYIDTLGTREGLEAEMQKEAVATSRLGKIGPAKLYQAVLQEMKMQKQLGATEYHRQTNPNKLMKIKLDIEAQGIEDQELAKGSIEQDTAAIRNDAMKAWVNNALTESAEYDDVQLLGERIIHDEKVRLAQAKEAAEAKQAQEGQKKAAELRKKQDAAKAAAIKKEQTRVSKQATTVAKKTTAVQDLAAKLRKPVPGPTRTEELEETKTAKAARESEIKRQVERVEGLERPKTPIKKGKAKVDDLRKDTSNFVILTSDNPNSTAAPAAVNVKNRSALKKKLDDLGIDYTIGDESMFYGDKEKPFIIHNMSKAEGQKLSDSLDQSSFIVAEGKNVSLVDRKEGTTTVPRKSLKRAPDAKDIYTTLAGEKFAIDFFPETEADTSAITDKAAMQELLNSPDIKEAYGDIKVDAIGEEGTTTPAGSVSVTILKDSPSTVMAGNTVNIETDGRRDFKEQLDEKAKANEAIRAQFPKVMKQMESDGTTQVSTLQIMETMQEQMKSGPFSFLFKRTKAAGTKTIFVTEPGQYGQLQEVIDTYPNLKRRDTAISEFDGLRGVYLPEQNVTVINLPSIARNAKQLNKAFETVVHEHVHAAHAEAFKSMSLKEQQEFGRELNYIWNGIDPTRPLTYGSVLVSIR